jgi:hypothetical protein
MALKKRKPGLIVEKAEERLKGMRIINSNYDSVIDYGGSTNPLSSNEIELQIKKCVELNSKYNEALNIADECASALKESESLLADMYSRILPGCVSKFGSDAPEISVLGGTRKSERKKPEKKNKIIK